MDTQEENSGKYIVGLIIIGLLILGAYILFGEKESPGLEENGAQEEAAPINTAQNAAPAQSETATSSKETIATSTASTTPEMIVSTTVPKETHITYSAQGFTLKTVTIKKGETVVFENKTGKPASIASAPHPTHTIYPEFDQYKTDQRGKDEFRFTFEKVGTWKYHDHLNATMTGTIVVTE